MVGKPLCALLDSNNARARLLAAAALADISGAAPETRPDLYRVRRST